MSDGNGFFDKLLNTKAHQREVMLERETDQAMAAQKAALVDGGEGMARERVKNLDLMAHHIKVKMAGECLAHARAIYEGMWKPLAAEHEGEVGSMAAIQSIEKNVLFPVILHKTMVARHHIDAKVAEYKPMFIGDAMAPGHLASATEQKKAFKSWFFDTLGPEATGCEAANPDPLVVAAWSIHSRGLPDDEQGPDDRARQQVTDGEGEQKHDKDKEKHKQPHQPPV